MTSWVGKSIAHYRVTSQIGAGGMGEVYRASDSRLGRDVAIKVLPAEFALDAERMARFEREARLLASLSHANIASIYGIEEVEGSRALVMELVEGPTLADRIAKGALPLEEALPIARQIADALEYAHERSIIHRDLKPANIKLTPDGTVKVLDFGLAKALSDDPSGSGSDLSKSPTLTAASTRLGVILGTAAYMSPEQAKGKAVDRRADIWSFGAVLLEMLTGERTFAGETVSETLASVMKDEPDWSALPAAAPARVRDVLRRCLVKDPRQRLRDIGEARIRIEEEIAGKPVATDATAAAPVTAERRGVPVLPVVLIAIVAAAVAGFIGYRMHADRGATMYRATIALPEGMTLDDLNTSIALSPDGRTVALAASATGKPLSLWLRRLDRPDPVRLEGTDGATYPFWSPDGRTLGFFAEHKLKRIAADGGGVQTICDAVDGRGASWGSDGTIVFAPGPLDGLMRVSAVGGAPVAVTQLDSVGVTHRLPEFFPDGKRLLFAAGVSLADPQAWIECLDLATKKRTRVFRSESQVRIIDANHVAYIVDHNLVVQNFDAKSLKLVDRPVPIAQDIQVNPYRFAGSFDLAASGALVWLTRAQSRSNQPTWYSLDGRELGKLGGANPVAMFALSPDGRRLATCERTDKLDLWITDVTSGVRTRFTFGPASAFPVWSADMKTLFFADGAGAIWARPADGSSQPRTILDLPGTSIWPGAALQDGSALLCQVQRPQSGIDICTLSLSGGGKPIDLIAGPGNQGSPACSPDGRWLAYDTDESGSTQVVVVPLPSLQGRWQVSSQGGDSPHWLPDGRGLVYETDDRRIMRVTLDGRGASLVVGETTTMLDGKSAPGNWALAPDGKRLLVMVPSGAAATAALNLVTDWHQLLANNN